MQIRSCPTALLLLVLCVTAARADGGQNGAASSLAEKLGKVSSVSFYFLSRTGEYDLKTDQFKAQSTIKIYRKCGNNCRQFMNDVVAHLRQARLTKCTSGQQNILIEAGKSAILLYSYSGRTIEFEGKCYFNRNGIDSTIKRTEFLFN